LREWQDLTKRRSTKGPQCFIESHVAEDLVPESVSANCFSRTENAMNEDNSTKPDGSGAFEGPVHQLDVPFFDKKIYAYGI
jgi:hypothetical protein